MDEYRLLRRFEDTRWINALAVCNGGNHDVLKSEAEVGRLQADARAGCSSYHKASSRPPGRQDGATGPVEDPSVQKLHRRLHRRCRRLSGSGLALRRPPWLRSKKRLAWSWATDSTCVPMACLLRSWRCGPRWTRSSLVNVRRLAR